MTLGDSGVHRLYDVFHWIGVGGGQLHPIPTAHAHLDAARHVRPGNSSVLFPGAQSGTKPEDDILMAANISPGEHLSCFNVQPRAGGPALDLSGDRTGEYRAGVRGGNMEGASG